MNKLFILGTIAGIGLGIAHLVKKKLASSAENKEPAASAE